MDTQFKAITLDQMHVKAEGDARTFEGYASVFHHLDHDGDIVLPGAFKDSLAKRMPRSLYQHNTKQVPSVIRFAEEDSKGLLVKGEFIDSTLGRDVYAEVKSGGIDQMSIGYVVKKSRMDRQKNARMIEAVDLYEVSWVTFPANDLARVTRVKSLDGVSVESLHEHKRMVEAALLDAGASNSIAAYVASLIPARRDAGGEELISLLNQFKL